MVMETQNRLLHLSAKAHLSNSGGCFWQPNQRRKRKMQFINYNVEFTTWTVWSAGLLVKDAITLTFTDHNTREEFTVQVMVNYSAHNPVRMTEQLHEHLDNRMLDKHEQYYYYRVERFRQNVVLPLLDELKGKHFTSVNQFIRVYNGKLPATNKGK
jgi:hypothetical protein